MLGLQLQSALEQSAHLLPTLGSHAFALLLISWCTQRRTVDQ
jgi:hypothetical protein